MAWKQVIRNGVAPKIRREWFCDACEHRWITVQSEEEAEMVPDCPACEGSDVPPEQVFRPIPKLGNASRALALAQHIAETQFGKTNIRDHLQKGETANMPPSPIQTAEADAITREIINAGGVPPKDGDRLKPLVQNFFRSPDGGVPAALGPLTREAALQMAAPAAAETRASGHDPMALLHEAGKKGLDPTSRKNLIVHNKRPVA